MLRRRLSLFAGYCVIIGAFVIAGLWGNRAATVFSGNGIKKDTVCFVIDAGHGGIDGGAVSCSGVAESTINLQISLRLRDLLHLLGYDTIMIRTEDVSIYTSGNTIAAKKASDLKERVRIINSTDRAVLLSIHQNHFVDSFYRGGQVFYASTEGSKLLAEAIQNQFVCTINLGSNRKIKPVEGIYIMKHIACPAVLIECGFLSNPEEEFLLRSDDYQKKVCMVISTACSDFLEKMQLDPTVES